MTTDEKHMILALEEARAALSQDEIQIFGQVFTIRDSRALCYVCRSNKPFPP